MNNNTNEQDDYDIPKYIIQRKINEAIKDYQCDCYVEPPNSDINSSNYHKKLNRIQVNQAVIAMILHLNLAGGSAGDFDLYKLLQAYMLDLDKRNQLNEVLKG